MIFLKKKLYDFSTGNAIIVLIAYALLLIVGIFNVINSPKIRWVALAFTILLLLSLAAVIWYFVILAVTVTDDGIKHGHKFIHRKDAKWEIQYNSRFRYSEIIFTDKFIDYKKLDKKMIKKKRIVVQYFPEYEAFLSEYFAKNK